MFSYLNLERRSVNILFVPYLEATDPRYEVRIEGNIVFALWFGVNVSDDDIDHLSRVALLEVDVPHEVDILKDIRRCECARE
jgi:hypothetical protein